MPPGFMSGPHRPALDLYQRKFCICRLKDAAGQRAGSARYNPRTLQIPPGWFKEAKIPEGQRQW